MDWTPDLRGEGPLRKKTRSSRGASRPPSSEIPYRRLCGNVEQGVSIQCLSRCVMNENSEAKTMENRKHDYQYIAVAYSDLSVKIYRISMIPPQKNKINKEAEGCECVAVWHVRKNMQENTLQHDDSTPDVKKDKFNTEKATQARWIGVEWCDDHLVAVLNTGHAYIFCLHDKIEENTVNVRVRDEYKEVRLSTTHDLECMRVYKEDTKKGVETRLVVGGKHQDVTLFNLTPILSTLKQQQQQQQQQQQEEEEEEEEEESTLDYSIPEQETIDAIFTAKNVSLFLHL